jgi:predicted branched-subunit amino acid permease
MLHGRACPGHFHERRPLAFTEGGMTRANAGFIKAFRHPPAAAIVLCASFVGFGVLCHGAHIGLAGAVYSTIFIFALPAQVILVDQIAREAPLWTAVLAVGFTGVRLLPMTVSLMPHLRGGGRPKPLDYLAAHFIAVTMWIESMRRIPFLPRGMRVSYYFGLGVLLIGVSVAGAVAGYLLADRLPRTVAAALIFLTPIYFTLGLLGNARTRADYAPLLLGFCAAPLFMRIAPSVDLVAAGLFGGTLSFLAFRRRRKPSKRRSASDPGDG